MTAASSSAARSWGAGVLTAALLLAGCGGAERRAPPPERGVRAAASAYVGALAARDYARACRLMTATARRDLADAAGASCADALSAGAVQASEDLATVRREVDGAEIRVRGATATIGPFGPAQQPLRLRREAGRWLVAG